MHNLLNPLIALCFLGLLVAIDNALVVATPPEPPARPRTIWRVLYVIAAIWLFIVVILALLGFSS